MADIELVIKIPEEIINGINDENYQSIISWYDTTLYCAIKNGTPRKVYKAICDKNALGCDIGDIKNIIRNGTPLEEIPNPCIECSQNCCVCELNGEKCECQRVYVVKENKK